MDEPVRITREGVRKLRERNRIVKKLGELLAEMERHDPSIGEIRKLVEGMGASDISVLIRRDASIREEPGFTGKEIDLGYMSHVVFSKKESDRSKLRLLAATLLHEATHVLGYGEFPAWYINFYVVKKLLGRRGLKRFLEQYELGRRPMRTLYDRYKRRFRVIRLLSGVKESPKDFSFPEMRAFRWLLGRGVPPSSKNVKKWLEGSRDFHEAMVKRSLGLASPEELFRTGVVNEEVLSYLLKLAKKDPEKYAALLSEGPRISNFFRLKKK